MIIFHHKRAFIRYICALIGFLFVVWYFLDSSSKNSDSKVLFLLDRSLSMKVQDIGQDPTRTFLTRFESAKKIIANVVDGRSISSVALAGFSENITLFLPFTDDVSLVHSALTGVLPVKYTGGSNISGSLQSLFDLYGNTPMTVVIFTDAEFFDQKVESIKVPSHIRVLFVAIGTEKGGPMLVGYGAGGKPLYKEKNGEKVISALSQKAAHQWAEKFQSPTLLISRLEDIEDISKKLQVYLLENKELLYSWKLIIGVLFLLVSLFIRVYVPDSKTY